MGNYGFQNGCLWREFTRFSLLRAFSRISGTTTLAGVIKAQIKTMDNYESLNRHTPYTPVMLMVAVDEISMAPPFHVACHLGLHVYMVSLREII